MRKERDKTDREVDRNLDSAQGAADEVLGEAREAADEVLRVSRAAEDAPSAKRTAERDRADARIHREREEADHKLEGERRDRTLALAELFALEREVTNQHLSAERDRADTALRNRDDFLAMVAHDLRGFMGDIALGAGVLLRTAVDDERGLRATRIAHGIQRATAGMKRLVGDLLDVAAIEAGRLHVDAQPGDIAGVLRDAIDPFRAAAAAKGISLDLHEPPQPVVAVFDHDRILQILGNLVGNAIKFTPRGGSIALRLDVAGREATLTVADTGVGMEQARLEHIFERYTQIALKDRRGVGLGLYIARCLVETQRGRIWATSTPGSGSSFAFTLPLAS